MVSRKNGRRSLLWLLITFLILTLFLVGCERPLQDDGGPEEAETVTEADPDQGAGAPADAGDEAAESGTVEEGEETGAVESGESEETTVAEEEDEADSDEADEEMTEEEPAAESEEEEAADAGGEEEEAQPELVEEAGDGDEEEASPRPAEEETEATATPVPDEAETAEAEVTEEEVAEEEAAEAETAEAEAAEETVHIVQSGENLYRIGLQYGISWVAIANNNPEITNPNRITVGQAIVIPGDPGADQTPETETTYVVRPGDTLYRIGRAFGLPWTTIAEANDIVNPNQIYVGQVLTIPAGGSGEAPGFTHTVQRGETLFLVSLQYGVPWTAIATANDISPPYIIYPGDVLTIPGG